MARRHAVQRRFLLLAAFAALTSACAGQTPATQVTTAAPTAAPTPTPFAGRTLAISATSNVFSIKDVEVAAGQDFEITFTNHDDGSHAIYVTEGVRPIVMQSLDDYRNGPYPFKGEYIKGPSASTTYHVAALAAGAYQFFCPPHRDMVIALTVK